MSAPKLEGGAALGRLAAALDKASGDAAAIIADALCELAERAEAYLEREKKGAALPPPRRNRAGKPGGRRW